MRYLVFGINYGSWTLERSPERNDLKHDDIDEGARGEPLQDSRCLTGGTRQLRHCQPDPDPD